MDELTQVTVPKLPLKVIVGAVVLEHITALPAVIDAVPETDFASTVTAEISVFFEGHAAPSVKTAR